MRKLSLWASLVLLVAMGPAELRAEGSEAIVAAAPGANPAAVPSSSAHPIAEQVLERLRARGRVTAGAPLELQRSVYFTGTDGTITRLDAGTYGLQREGPAIRIRPAEGGDGLLLRATSMVHDRAIGGPIALSVPGRGERADVHLVTLLLPGGEALTAIGTHSGVIERGLGDWLKSAGNTIVGGFVSAGETAVEGAVVVGGAVESGAAAVGGAAVSAGEWIGDAAVTSYDEAAKAVEAAGQYVEDTAARFERCVGSGSTQDCLKLARDMARAYELAWNAAVAAAEWLLDASLREILCKAVMGLMEGAAWIEELGGPLRAVVDEIMSPVTNAVSKAAETALRPLTESGEAKLAAVLTADPNRFAQLTDGLSVVGSVGPDRLDQAQKFLTSCSVCELSAAEIQQRLFAILGPGFAQKAQSGIAATSPPEAKMPDDAGALYAELYSKWFQSGAAGTTGSSSAAFTLDSSTLPLRDGQVVAGSWGGAVVSGSPLFRLSSTPNGKPAVEFDGRAHLGNVSIRPSATQDFVIAAVIRPERIGAYHNIVDGVGAVPPMLWIDGSNRYELNIDRGEKASIGSGPGGWDIVIADSRTNTMYVNGRPVGASGQPTGYPSAKSFGILNRGGKQAFKGQLAELRVYTTRNFTSSSAPAAAVAPTSGLQDGGFELGLTSPGKPSTPLASFGRWTAAGEAGGVVLLGLPYHGIPVRDRGHEAMHIGNNTKAGGVKQSFPTEAGREYQATLWAANWPGMGTGTGSVTLNGGALLNETFPAAAAPQWTRVDYRFTATGSVTTLEIQNRRGSALTIDDVEVTPAPAPAVVAKPSSPTPPPPAPALAVENVLGEYRQDPLPNAWGSGRIEKDASGQLRWTNDAGVSWTLNLDVTNQRLMTGPENPYYDYQGGVAAHREFKLIVQDNQVVGFSFSNATYHRKAPRQGGFTAASVVGNYRSDPVLNQWHVGAIVQQNGRLLWSNKAGISWTLTPDFANQRLTTGPDNPYYNYQGGAAVHREFKLIVRNNQIAGFTFNGGTYLREEPGAAGGIVSRGIAPAESPPSDGIESDEEPGRRTEWIPASRVAAGEDSETRDQSWVPSTGQGQAIGRGSSSAQTFTAGKTGLLTSVALGVYRKAWANSDLIVEIRRVDDRGLPNEGRPLFSSAFAPSVFPISSSDVLTAIDVRSAGVHVKRGDRLAITVTNNGPVSYDWSHADGYRAGQGLVMRSGAWTDLAADFTFATEVDEHAVAVATREAPAAPPQPKQPGPFSVGFTKTLKSKDIGPVKVAWYGAAMVHFPNDPTLAFYTGLHADADLESRTTTLRKKGWSITFSMPMDGGPSPFAAVKSGDGVLAALQDRFNVVISFSATQLAKMYEAEMKRSAAVAATPGATVGIPNALRMLTVPLAALERRFDTTIGFVFDLKDDIFQGLTFTFTAKNTNTVGTELSVPYEGWLELDLSLECYSK